MDLNSSKPVCNYTVAWMWLSSLQPPFLVLISILGMVGNSLVLFVFCLQRKPCKVADIYLGNLAAADLIMLVCLPFWIVTIAQDYQWNYGQLLCKLVNTAISMNYFCSILFLVLVSMDRYLALVKPMKRFKLRRPAYVKRICLVIWAAGFLFSLPAFLFRKVSFFAEIQGKACYLDYPDPAWRLQWNFTINIVGFLIPIIVISFCTYHMVSVLRNGLRIQARVQTERKATHLVLAVLAVFLFCWMPFQLVRFLDTLQYFNLLPGCLWEHIVEISIQLVAYLGYSNSSVNPFLYVIVGSHFRKKARGVFRNVLCPRWGNSSSMLTNVTVISKYNECPKESQDRITSLNLRSVCLNTPQISSGV